MDETLTAIEQALGVYGSPVSALDEIERLQRAVVLCEQERELLRGALLRYTAHDRDCGLCGLNVGDVCTCGLDDLFAALRPPTST